MKCKYCGNEWKIGETPKGNRTYITGACPACGKMLMPESIRLPDFQQLLCKVRAEFGEKALFDRTKLLNCCEDLAPHLSRERRLLEHFFEAGVCEGFLAVQNLSSRQQQDFFQKAVKTITEETYLDETAAAAVCEAFLLALSGKFFPSMHRQRKQTVSVSDRNQGQIAEQQFLQGEEFYKKACQGIDSANNFQKACACYKNAADYGHAMAQCQLGVLYQEGRGVAKDEKKAFEYFMQSAIAEKNCARAQFYVGFCYYYGKGVQKDIDKAVYWHTLSAENGDSYAQGYLGFFLETGKGLPVDYRKASEWYEKAAQQGNVSAQYNLARLYMYGKGVPSEPQKAVPLFRKAAEQGNMYAQYTLGTCYETGNGIMRSEKEAVFWFTKAMQQGYAEAAAKLGRCYAEGRSVAQNEQKAAEMYEFALKKGCTSVAVPLLKIYFNKEKRTEKECQMIQQAFLSLPQEQATELLKQFRIKLLSIAGDMCSYSDTQSTGEQFLSVALGKTPVQAGQGTDSKTNSADAAATSVSVPASKRKVPNYGKYKKDLESYYLQLGGQPLTESQIFLFIESYSLHKFQITTDDVRQDLQEIYAKHQR